LLSFHVYSNNPSDYVTAAEYYRGLLDTYNYRSAELHITEWNTARHSRNQTGVAAGVSPPTRSRGGMKIFAGGKESTG